MANIPNTATWIATGNNVSLSIEIGRRVIPIRLDAEMEHPEERSGFRNTLPGWAYAHRPELVSACLSLARAWIDAGRPGVDAVLGRYEAWVAVVGGIVELAGFGDFLANRAERVATADHESLEWTVFVQAWWDRYREEPVTAGPLLKLAAEQQVLMDLHVGRTILAGTQRLGHALAGRRDRVFGEWVIRAAGRDAATGNLSHRLERHDASTRRASDSETTRLETPETTGIPADQEGWPSVFAQDGEQNNGRNTKNNDPNKDTENQTVPGREGSQTGVSVVPVVSGEGVSDPLTPSSSANGGPTAEAVDRIAADVEFLAFARPLKVARPAQRRTPNGCSRTTRSWAHSGTSSGWKPC